MFDFQTINDEASGLMMPLLQSPHFARTAERLKMPLRSMQRTNNGQVTMRWQVQSRHFGPLGRFDLISRGPVAQNEADLRNWLAGFHRWQDGRPLVLNADHLHHDDLRAAGFWPLVTPTSIAMLPLGDAAEMRKRLHQKWRNRLNRAMTMGLRLTCRPLEPDDWILAAEVKQAATRGYRGLPARLSAAFGAANPGHAVFFEAHLKGEPVAGAVLLRHGRMATWQIGITTDEGRACHAMNALLWQAMTHASDRGHDALDLGIVNTEDARGLAHFKLGTGAEIHRLSGSWLHFGALAPFARRLPSRLAA